MLLYLSLSSFIIFKNTKQTYGVNDDVIIQNWLSGFYTGSPEFMIRGSATPRITFGFIVSNLYKLIPSINWYSFILLALVVLSWYLLGLIAIRSTNILVYGTYLVVSFLHLLWFIPSPTYTAASIIASFTIVVYALKQILEDVVSKNLIALSIIYAFAFLVRPESFFVGTIVTVPFILFILFKRREVLKKSHRIIITSIITAATIIGVDVIFEITYYHNNQNWTQYRDWETSRYRIQANAPEKALLDNPNKYGWTEASAEVFASYNAIDPEYFSTRKLNQLIQDTQVITQVDFDFIKKSHQQIFDSDFNWEWNRLIQIIAIIFLIFLLLSMPKPLEYIFLSTTSIGIIYVIMFYVAGFLRQPERVQVSIIFLCILVSWVSYSFTEKKIFRTYVDQFIYASLLLFILVLSSAFNQASYLTTKVAGASNAFWYTQSRFLSFFPKDSIFVGNASQFRNNWSSPYKLEYFEPEKRIMSFGWHNFSPHWVKRAQNLGLDPNNILQSVIADKRVFWVSDVDSMQNIVNFMIEKGYQFKGPERVGQLEYVGSRYTVWNFDLSD